MKEIYLKSLSTGRWELFTYSQLSDISTELSDRGITIIDKDESLISGSIRVGNNSSVGEGKIGLNVSIGDNVSIDKDFIFEEGVFISDGVTIGEDVILHSKSIIGSGTTLASGIEIGRNTKVSGGITLSDKYHLNLERSDITYIGNRVLAFGCEAYDVDEWRNKLEETGAKYGWTGDQIVEYSRYLNHARDFINKL